MQFRLTFQILICDEFMSSVIKFAAYMPKYGHMVFGSQLSHFLTNPDDFFIQSQETTSFWACLGNLALMSQNWTKYGRGCTSGTGGRLGPRPPQNFGHGS